MKVRLAVRRTCFAEAFAGLLVASAALAPVAPAQPRPATAAALAPDTVKVGDPFTLGLSIAGRRDAEVQFPALVTLAAELEQLRPVDVK